MSFKYGIVILIGFACQVASAQVPEVKSPLPEIPFPTISIKTGQEAVVTWTDGSEAKLMRSAINDKVIPVPTIVTENLCVPSKIGMMCSYDTHVRSFRIALVWTKHQDATKIGNVVEVDTSYDKNQPPRFTALEDSVTVFSTEQFFSHVLSKGIARDQIRCDDFSWIPGVQGQNAPKQVEVVRWESELMMENPETGTNENRPIGGYMGVVLEAVNDKTLVFQSIRHITGAFSPIPPVTGTSSVTFPLPKNSAGRTPLCQVTVRNDFATVQAMARELSVYKDFTPYIWGSDESIVKISGKKNPDESSYRTFQNLTKEEQVIDGQTSKMVKKGRLTK